MDNYTWDINPDDKMAIIIKCNGKQVMRLFIGEAMESAGRKNVMKHISDCDKTPWLTKWHEDMMDEEVRILKGNDL